jgi:hypothetical protein
MAVTFEEVRAALDPEEPNYQKAREFGPDALPHLRKLVAEGGPMLAAKATYLASLIGSEGAHAVVHEASNSAHPTVRVAAASAAHNLPRDVASSLVAKLSQDEDMGVRHAAQRAVPSDTSPVLGATVATIAESEPAPTLATTPLVAVGAAVSAPAAPAPPETPAIGAGRGGGMIRAYAGTAPGAGRGGGVISSVAVPGGSTAERAGGKGGGAMGAAAPAPRPKRRKAAAAKTARPKKAKAAAPTAPKSAKGPKGSKPAAKKMARPKKAKPTPSSPPKGAKAAKGSKPAAKKSPPSPRKKSKA